MGVENFFLFHNIGTIDPTRLFFSAASYDGTTLGAGFFPADHGTRDYS